MSRKRDRSDRVEYRSLNGDAAPRDRSARDDGLRSKPNEPRSTEVDPNAKTLPIWRNGPPDELYPDEDRRT